MSLFPRRGARIASLLAIVFAFSTAVFADTPATEQLKATISNSAGMLVVADHMLDRDALSRFYALRQYQLAWSSDALDQRRTDIVIARIEHADEEGLEPADYRADELRTLRARLNAAQFDLILTDTLIHYLRDLRTGRSSVGFVDRDVALPPVNFDAVQATVDLFQQKDFDAALAHWNRRTRNMRSSK